MTTTVTAFKIPEYSKEIAHNKYYGRVQTQILRDNINVQSVFLEDTAIKQSFPQYAEYRAKGLPLPVLPYTRTVSKFIGVPFTRFSFKLEGIDKGEPTYLIRENTYKSGLVAPRLTLAQYQSQFGSLKTSEVQNTARASLQQHLNDVKWEAPVDAAELDKTVGMFINRFNKTVSYLETFRRLNMKTLLRARKNLLASANGRKKLNSIQLKALKKTGRELNDMFLEFTYGWTPLAMSVEDIMEYLQEKVDGPLRTKVSGHGFLTSTKDTSYGPNTLAWSSGEKVQYTESHFVRYDVWMGGLLERPASSSLARKAGLTSDNIIPSLVELTRFSFLADYFLNVSDFIGNLNNKARLLNASTMYMSEKWTCESSVKVESVRPLPSTPTVVYVLRDLIIDNDSKYQLVHFKRTPLTYTDTIVRLTPQIPSWDQLLNTASIATKVLGLLR